MSAAYLVSMSVATGGGLLALAFAAAQTASILRADEGTELMRSIAGAIREGASAFLRREYTVVLVVGLVIAAVIVAAFGLNRSGLELAIGFLLGAIGSAAAGAFGVLVSVRANVRTAAVACRRDLRSTMRFAFRAGSITGLGVAGLATLELVGCYALVGGNVLAMAGLLVGASLMSLFARVGGGIYTKGADVGADLVGKLETKIPEDDPRNPAVIADNVGDNVGDCAGMAADLFETYLVTAVAAMLLGYLIRDIRAAFPNAVLYPLAVSGCGLLATLAGTPFVRMRPRGTIMGALYRGLGATMAFAVLGLYLLDRWLMHGSLGVFLATLVGLVVVAALVGLTNYYTSSRFRPVARIAASAEAGAGPVVITGISVGLASVALPGLVIAAGMLAAFFATGWTAGHLDPELGLYGIGLAAASMLAVMGMIISIDAFGPITDNAGGIAEMAMLPAEARATTDALDAVGNTTKAITKGYAIGSAALAALSLFAAYTFAAADKLGLAWATFTHRLTIDNPLVVVGLVIGALLPFFFTSFLMNAVSVAAQAVVFEVRRQFKELPGVVQGTARPEYGRCVAIVTTTALQQLIVPGAVAVGVPLAVGFLLGPVALAGVLLGVVISGFPLALFMTTSGAAWDNAKKYIEHGHFGGKHSPADAAAIVGDTVGDATKDAAGPAINPLIKVVNTVSLLCIGQIVSHGLSLP
jgi:K(+)-stimulated pyrophosphate-energized sodium pump